MFRRLPETLPPDVVYPPSLERLGYFVNGDDQIRQIANPDQKYQFKINRNDRVNDVYKEAMNTCTRQIVLDRLLSLGLEELRLPLGTSTDDKHVKILVSKDIATKKHVIVLFPERHTDPGIFAYRVIGEEGINTGSAVNFVREINRTSITVPNGDESQRSVVQETPRIIIANPSQLIWYRGGGRTVTDREWMCLPRPSMVHEPMRIDHVKNRVDHNKDFKEHIQYIFEHVLSAKDGESSVTHPETKFSIIGQEYVGTEALTYLSHNWLGWRNRINCVALINPQHHLHELFNDFDESAPGDVAHRAEVERFIKRRCRAYRLSLRPLETLLSGREELGCNIYAAGETSYEESCFIRCWPSILDWIEICRVSKTYAEPDFEFGESDDETGEIKVKSPRRKQIDDEQQEEARFHGELKVTDAGVISTGDAGVQKERLE